MRVIEKAQRVKCEAVDNRWRSVLIDVDVAVGARVVALARLLVFLDVLGAAETLGAEARQFAVRLRRPDAAADAAANEERLSAPGALLLRFT